MSIAALHASRARNWVGIVALPMFVIASLAAVASAPAQESKPLSEKPWRVGVGTGASFFWGAEGNTVGFELESGLMRRVRHTPAWIRGDLMLHHYGAQPVYPCLLQANETCYSMQQRSIVGAAIGAQYDLKPLKQNPSARPYLLAGLATYVSSRRAFQPPICQSNELCPNVTPRHEFSETDFGVQVGIGTTWTAGKREFFLESKYHQRIIRANERDPFTTFRFSPISAGVRF